MLSGMWLTGGFWDDESSRREYCYKIIPRAIANDAREMTVRAFDIVYKTLGKLGYRFRDAGNNHEKVVISLNKSISPKHLKQLEEAFSIETDSGTDLAFI